MNASINASLRCEIRIVSGMLRIHYEVINHGQVDLGIFNWIPTRYPDGTKGFLSSTAYIELRQGHLLVSKSALSIPNGLHVGAYVPPLASSIPVSQSFGETLLIVEPIRVMQPFVAALTGMGNAGQVTADVPAVARTLSFAVGVFPLVDGCQLVPEQPAFPAVLTARPPGVAVAGQRTLQQNLRLERPLHVLDYRSVAWPP